jgi:hypothetical protein
VPEGSAIARALDYSLKRWVALTRYLDDGDVSDRQQLGGKPDPPLGDRALELVVCGILTSGAACGP